MAVSFTAEYLYQGARLLSSNPPEDYNDQNLPQNGNYELFYAIARAVYALGIAVIAPLGALYHLGAAGICALQCESAQEHLDAAVCDLTGFGQIALGITFIALEILNILMLSDLIHLMTIVSLGPIRDLILKICVALLILGLAVLPMVSIRNVFLYSQEIPALGFAFQPQLFASFLPADRQLPATLPDG